MCILSLLLIMNFFPFLFTSINTIDGSQRKLPTNGRQHISPNGTLHIRYVFIKFANIIVYKGLLIVIFIYINIIKLQPPLPLTIIITMMIIIIIIIINRISFLSILVS